MRFGGWRDAFEGLACRLPNQPEHYSLYNPVSRPAHGVHFHGPEFVSFEGMIKDEKWSEINSQNIQFMIFLRKADGGEYEFVTGQVDPRFSVKQMRQSPYRWPDEPEAKQGRTNR